MLLLATLMGCPGVEAPGDDTASADDVVYDTYACGWEKRDPGTLASTGTTVGSVLADLETTDQCGESFRVWDMFGDYFLLYFTAAW